MSFLPTPRSFALPSALLAVSFTLSSCGSFSGGPLHSKYGDRPGPKNFTTVVLDSGHGGRDTGAVANGLQEKHVVNDVVRRLRKDLNSQFKVMLIRDSDNFIELDERVRQANRHNNAILISVHFNHGPKRISGPETFYWRSDSYSLGKRVQSEMSKVTPNKSGNRGLVRRRLRLTRNPEIPSILLEGGYLTNAREASLLKTEAYRQTLANAIGKAIRDQAKFGDLGMGPIPKPIYMPRSKASDPRGSL